MRKFILFSILILLIPFAAYSWMGAVIPAGGTVAADSSLTPVDEFSGELVQSVGQAAALLTDADGGDGTAVTIADNIATFTGYTTSNFPFGDAVGDIRHGDLIAYGDNYAIIKGLVTSGDADTITASQAIAYVTIKDGSTAPTAASNSAFTIYRQFTGGSLWESNTGNTNITASHELTDTVLNDSGDEDGKLNVIFYDDITDTTRFDIDGWTTSITQYINAYVASGHTYTVSNAVNGLTISDQYTRCGGFILSSSTNKTVFLDTDTVGVHLYGCTITNGGTQIAIAVENTNTSTMYIYNNIIYEFASRGIQLDDADATVYFYNNTLADGTSAGIYNIAGTIIAKNNIVSDTVNENYIGTFDAASDGNWSDDTYDTGGTNDIKSDDAGWDDVRYVNQAGDDYHLAAKSGEDAGPWDNGIDIDEDANLPITTDFDGDARSASAPDCGADEI